MHRPAEANLDVTGQTELHFEQELHFILLMGRTHCAHRYFLSHSLRLT